MKTECIFILAFGLKWEWGHAEKYMDTFLMEPLRQNSEMLQSQGSAETLLWFTAAILWEVQR